jgi:ADP-heptose:LPS heptosyltransferase
MKILVIRFSSIGDIVLTSPVLRCIKNQLKEAELHFVTKKQYAGILESNPHVDKLYSINQKISEVLVDLKNENYDYVIDLHHNLRSAAIKWKLGKKSKSFDKLNLEKWLMVNLKKNILPTKHIVDRYFATLQPLGVVNDGKGLDYFIPEKSRVDVATLPGTFTKGYIAFVMGATYATKQLPKEKILSIAAALKQPVILLGGKEDAAKGDWIVSHLTPHPNSYRDFHRVFNACGKYNLHQSASIIEQATKVISHDTGLMHIAAAFKKEMVSVWGNTLPEFGMYPYYGAFLISNFKSQVSNLSCRPCSKLGFHTCPKKHFSCMNNINEEEITKFVGGGNQ